MDSSRRTGSPAPEGGRRPALHRLADVAWRVLVVALAVLALLFLLARLRLVVLPVFIAALLTTMLAPLADRLERRGVPRLAATWAVFAGFAGVLALLGVVVVPAVIDEFAGLDEALSAGVDDIERWLTEGPLDLSQEELRRYRAQGGEAIREFVGGTSGIVTGAIVFVEVIASAILALVVTFFFVKDGARMREWGLDHLPRRHRDPVDASARAAWEALGAYLRGAALIGAIEGVIIGGTLAVTGVPLALPVGVLTFVGGFVPIVGAVVTGVVAVLVALVGGGTGDALVVAVVALVVQQVDTDLLAPLIYGRMIRLHPLVIILSVTAAGSVAGITGTFLAVPTAAMMAAVGGELWRRRAPDDG